MYNIYTIYINNIYYIFVHSRCLHNGCVLTKREKMINELFHEAYIRFQSYYWTHRIRLQSQ